MPKVTQSLDLNCGLKQKRNITKQQQKANPPQKKQVLNQLYYKVRNGEILKFKMQ